MASSGGTGQPLNFRCWKCRRAHGTNEYFGRYDLEFRRHSGASSRSTRKLGYGVTMLARRPRTTHRGGTRISDYSYRYRCNDCGHVGTSNHVTLDAKWKAQYE